MVFICVASNILRCYSPKPSSLTGSLAKEVSEGPAENGSFSRCVAGNGFVH